MFQATMFILALMSPTVVAHEWRHPHHDEELNLHDAQSLGFRIQIDRLQWYRQEASPNAEDVDGVPAVAIAIDYPVVITGQRILASAYFDGCEPLHTDIDERLASDELPSDIIQYKTDHVFPEECASQAIIGAIYGTPPANTFYWLKLWDEADAK